MIAPQKAKNTYATTEDAVGLTNGLGPVSVRG